jgi:hypothetical protein
MKIFQVIGYLLILWGVADFGLSYAGVDLWYSVLGINLEGAVYQYSGMAAIIIGW